MTITGIRNNVQSLLTNTTKFVTVLNHPPAQESDFAGFPSACHYYVDAESNYATVSQNRRVYEYVVELYIVTDATTTSEVEFGEAYALMDSIMQMFDESIDLSSTTLGLARACDIMRPTPSTLERITTKEGEGLMMTLKIYCTADVSFK